MTLVRLAGALRSPSGPAWAKRFTSDELDKALRKAKHDLELDSYVQVPEHLLMGVVSRAAVHLNQLDPERMAGGLGEARVPRVGGGVSDLRAVMPLHPTRESGDQPAPEPT